MKTLSITLASTFTILLVSVYIYISTQLDAEEIRITTIKKIEENFPHLRVNLGELSLEFGQSIILKTDNLELKTESDESLFKVKKANFKIPVFSILLGGGNIEVDITSPVLFYEYSDKVSLWEKALKDNTAKKLIEIKEVEEYILPAFLANSTLAIRLHDSEIVYKKNDLIKRSIINKLVVKNLGVNSNAAYEIKSNLSYPMSESKTLNFHTFIVGSINFMDYLESKTLPIKSSYKLENIGIEGHGDSIPMITGNIEILLNEKGEMNLKNSLRLEKTTLKHDLVLNASEFKVNELSGKVILSEFSPILMALDTPLKIREGEVDFKGTIQGDEKGYIGKVDINVNEMKGSLPGTEFTALGNLSLSNQEMALTSTVKLYEGTLNAESQMNYNINDKGSLENKIKDLKSKIKVEGVKLKSEDLKGFFSYHNDGIFLLPFFLILPNSTSSIELENSTLDQKKLTADISTQVNGSRLKVDKFKINYDQGEMKGKISGLHYKDGFNSKWNLNLKKFPSTFFAALIAEDNIFIDGPLDGKITGPFSIKDDQKIFDLKIGLESKGGSFTGVNLNDEYEQKKKAFSEIPILGSEIKWRETKLSNEYEILKLNTVIKDGLAKFSSIKLVTDKKLINLDLKGKLNFDKAQESLIEGKLKDKLGLSSYLKKKIAMKSVPIAFKGMGTDLSFDNTYMIDKFGRHFKGKEGKAQVEKVIDENVDKFIKGESGKTIKKLIKGFLK